MSCLLKASSVVLLQVLFQILSGNDSNTGNDSGYFKNVSFPDIFFQILTGIVSNIFKNYGILLSIASDFCTKCKNAGRDF